MYAASSALTLASKEGLVLSTEREVSERDSRVVGAPVELDAFLKLCMRSPVGGDRGCGRGVAIDGVALTAADSASDAAKLDDVLPTRRSSIWLSRLRIGPGESSSSESLHPNPVVKPTPSLRSFPSRCRRLRTSV